MSDYIKKLSGQQALLLLAGIAVAFLGFLIFILFQDSEFQKTKGLIFIVIGIVMASVGYVQFARNVSGRLKNQKT